MIGKFFLDTNVLVYMFSESDLDKKAECRQFVNDLDADNQVVWSTQVIQEFYFTLTKKHGKDPQEVKSSISNLSTFQLVINNFDTIERAIDIQIINKISFWDSLIISSAKQANCSFLLSEDLSHGQLIDGVRVVSPFRKMDF